MGNKLEAKIIDFSEDRGKNKDGRLTISIKKTPKQGIMKFLEWLGNEFLNKGGLYCVDIISPMGKYRVYKNILEKNTWVESEEA